MNCLQAGFARIDITPEKGVAINGYFIPRQVETVLDPLEINCLALSCDEKAVLLLAVDNCGIGTDVLQPIIGHVCDVTGLPREAVYIHSTHTHTGGALIADWARPQELAYREQVRQQAGKVALAALADRKPARMGYGVGTAPNVAFVRRFRMKDGSCRTNPGLNNPDVVCPLGDVDERVNVLRFDREGADTLVLMNFGNHPDTVGGNRISADWPGFARRTVEQAIPGTKAIFFNGAQGDVNHINVFPKGGDLNDLVMDFDDVNRGYGHARYVGRVVAGAVLQTYDKVCYTDVDRLSYMQRLIHVPSNMPAPEELPEAHRIAKLHAEGRDEELPYTGMVLTTVVAEALRMVRLEKGPEAFDMYLSGIAIGNVAMVGIPGEPFTGIGRALKETDGWDLVLPTCNTNGKEGYFPMQDAYDEGGYESRSSAFKAGVAEYIIAEGKSLLEHLK